MIAEAKPSVAFYIGGFEAIGGIEASFEDLTTALVGQELNLSLFVWAKDLPALRQLATLGADVYRTPLRSGCRYALPDWALYLAHRSKLDDVEKIVFGKFPPDAILRRLRPHFAARKKGPPEFLYVTAYRPAEMWPAGLPLIVRDTIDTMVVQSATFTQDLRAMGFTGRIVEIPYLPPQAADPPMPSRAGGRPCRLAFLGRFVSQKNLFYLLDILSRLTAKDVELHLYGEGEHDARLRAEAAERGLPVVFHGAVPRSGVPAAIDSADIFVNPSLSEGQCLVALEVLSRGRPFFASAVGAIPEIQVKGRFGRIFPLDDAAGAATVLDDGIEAWRAGEWDPASIVADYRSAYRPDVILAQYRELLTMKR